MNSCDDAKEESRDHSFLKKDYALSKYSYLISFTSPIDMFVYTRYVA